MVNKLRVLIYLYRDDLTKALFFFWQAIICNLLLCLYYHEKVKSKSISYSVVYNSLPSHGLEPTRSLCPWNSSVKNMGVGCHSLFQGIFLTQGSNSCIVGRFFICHLSKPAKSAPPRQKPNVSCGLWVPHGVDSPAVTTVPCMFGSKGCLQTVLSA